MPAARSQLKLVDEHGEIYDECPECRAKEGELGELYRKFKGQSRELAELRRDKEAEARDHKLWPIILQLFGYWQEQTGHKRVKWSPEHFWSALPLVVNWGVGNCAAAIAGAAHDPWTKETKNGKMEKYDDWETVFKNSGSVRRYINRRPRDWSLPEQFEEAG